MKSIRRNRGSALLTTLAVLGIILLVVSGIISYASESKEKATRSSRLLNRDACLQTGLQLARSYFGRSFSQWNTYLAAPSQYNPVSSAANTSPANPWTSSLKSSRPELFADLDGDGQYDVYIFIRDNEDEFAPAAPDWVRDNDQNVIVGAVCISSTLLPHALGGSTGSVPADALVIEGLLSYNNQSTPYSAQASHGVSGSGNLN